MVIDIVIAMVIAMVIVTGVVICIAIIKYQTFSNNTDEKKIYNNNDFITKKNIRKYLEKI